VLRKGVLIVFILDLSSADCEEGFDHIFEAISFLVGIAGEDFPLAVEVFFGGHVAEDEVEVEEGHDCDEEEEGDADDGEDDGEGVLFEGEAEVVDSADFVVAHEHDAHGEDDDGEEEEGDEEDEEVEVVAFADAGAQPRTVVVHFLDANPADIAVTGSRRPVDVAGHAKLQTVQPTAFWHNIADLNMRLDVLVLGNGQIGSIRFIFLALSRELFTIF
jgi:hypothetical protein